MLSLSWSRLSDFEQCPRKFHLKYIAKVFPPFDDGAPHLIKGRELHKQLETYILAQNGKAELPLGWSPEVKATLPFVDSLFKNFTAVYPETQVSSQFSVDPNLRWKPCTWFDKNSLYRAIWDVIALAPLKVFIGDWKSGKYYPIQPGEFGQLHLSSVIALHRFTAAEEVESAFLYLAGRQIDRIKVTRGEAYVDEKGKVVESLDTVQKDFERRFEIVQLEKEWKATPNEFCKWCEATKAQCQFSKKADFGNLPTTLPTARADGPEVA